MKGELELSLTHTFTHNHLAHAEEQHDVNHTKYFGILKEKLSSEILNKLFETPFSS